MIEPKQDDLGKERALIGARLRVCRRESHDLWLRDWTVPDDSAFKKFRRLGKLLPGDSRK